MIFKLGRTAALSAAATISAGAFALAAPSAPAALTNLAVCHARLHLTFGDGSFQTDSSSLDCRGVLDGQPVAPGGSIQLWGHYRQGSGCRLGWSDAVYEGQIPLTLEMFDRGELNLEGGQGMGPGTLMGVTGSGAADDQPFLESGTATFTPDGSPCVTVSSGTLFQSFTLVDGGDGNPGAVARVGQYLDEQYGAAGPTASDRGQSRRRHHGRHSRHARRHFKRTHRRHHSRQR
jgi:hypothetical protein